MIQPIDHGNLRPMTSSDVDDVLRIISEFDEDDAEEAAESYRADLQGHFVWIDSGQIVGVTGATPLEFTSASYSLATTCISEEVHEETIQWMVREVCTQLTEAGGRKLFAELSDYIDPEDGDIYRPLRRSLTNLDFQVEVTHENFYDRNESQIIWGRRLVEAQYKERPAETRGIRLTDIDEIPGADGCFWLMWEIDESADCLVRADFQKIYDQVESWGGRSVFVAFPSGFSEVDTMMQNSGFRFDGRLADLYDDGVDQLRFRYEF